MAHHISIFPEFMDRYRKFLPSNLVDVSLFTGGEDCVVFVLLISEVDVDGWTDCCSKVPDYREDVFNSGLTKKDVSLEELKAWFLAADVATHVYATNVFPSFYAPDLVKAGYEVLAIYSCKEGYTDQELVP